MVAHPVLSYPICTLLLGITSSPVTEWIVRLWTDTNEGSTWIGGHFSKIIYSDLIPATSIENDIGNERPFVMGGAYVEDEADSSSYAVVIAIRRTQLAFEFPS